MINSFRISIMITFLTALSAFSREKPIVINEYLNNNARIVNKHYNPQPLGGTCWQELDVQFINANNYLYGNEGYSSSNPLDDGTYGPISLGWTFSFYGQNYNALYVNVNGNVTFGNLHSAYSAQGFPSSSVPAMIAPFWGDVDLRGSGSGANKIYVKQESGKISIQWVGVGYYNQKTNVTNTFQLILTDGNDSEIGIGKNTRFAYDDMNWCVGDASGGSNGFGNNVYATVGAQSAGGADFYQIGLFGKDNTDYDGAGGALDGVHYLDGRCFTMDLSQVNVPPIANNFPNNRIVELCPGMTCTLESSFTAPEVGQSASTTVVNSTLSDFSFTTTNGNLSTQTITINPVQSDTGMHYIAYRSEDNGTPVAVSLDTLWVNVYNCGSSGSSSSLNFDGVDDYAVVHHHPGLYSGGTNTYSAWLYPDVQTAGGFIPLMQKEGQFKLGITGGSLMPSATILINEVEYSVNSSIGVEVGEWSHVCAVAEPAELKIYVNGEVTGTTPIPGVIDVTNKPLFVGGKELEGNYYKGRLDELGLVSRSCASEEVNKLRWELSSIDSAYVRAYFKCTNDVVLINNSSSYHGTLINMDDPNKWKNNYGKIWNGEQSGDFSNPSNWAEGLAPVLSNSGGIEADAYVIFDKVKSANFELNLTSQEELNSVVFTENANTVIGLAGQLRVHGNMYTYKSPTYDGEVLLTGIDKQKIYGTNEFSNLIIDNDVSIISPQQITGNLVLNTGVLSLEGLDLTMISDADGAGQIFHNSGSIVGEVTMERRMSYNSNSIGWHYISSPMSNMVINDLTTDLQIIGLGTGVESDPFPSLYFYDETTAKQDIIKGWTTPSDYSSNFDLLKGYIYYKYTKEEQKIRLKGEVFTGEVSQFLTHTSSGKVSSDGWHLLGNPYPCSMNWDNVNVPSSMDNAMYLYDNTIDAYKVYVDGIGINGASNRIPSMTSYFVHVNSPALFSIDNSVRVADSEAKHYKIAKEPSFMFTMSLNFGSGADETIVRIRKGASIAFDKDFDAYKILSSTGNNIYSILDSSNLAINSVDGLTDSIVVPIRIDTKSNVFNLDIHISEGWSDDYDVSLVSDNNKYYSVNEGSRFVISSAENSSQNYFLVIKLKNNQVTGITDQQKSEHSFAFIDDGLLVFQSNEYNKVRILSTEGKLLFEQNLNVAGDSIFDISEIKKHSQIVVVHLVGNDKWCARKVLFN